MHHRTSTTPRAVYTAIVHDATCVLFTAVAGTRTALIEQVAEYVRRSAYDLLWGADSVHVETLIRTGQPEAAIEHYFACVGQRWDDQWLITTIADAAPGISARLDGVVPHRTERPLTVAG